MANLKQCFVSEQSQNQDQSKYSSLQEESLEQNTPWGQSSGSRTLFATSLQLVLKGLIDHVLRSCMYNCYAVVAHFIRSPLL